MRGRSTYKPVQSTDDSEQADLEASGDGDNSRLHEESDRASDSQPDKSVKNDSHDDDKTVSSSSTSVQESDAAVEEALNDDGERITIVLLDSAQKRFPIDVNPDWTVGLFKKVGAKIHKVPPASQRLIFRGKMLDDPQTLRQMKIENEDAIVHLFPKPRVILTSSSDSVSVSSVRPEDEADGGAHVPQIVLDEEEQERRGQILVLGSYEIAEAQNNVRLLSLLLGTTCFMWLLNLLSLAAGTATRPVYGDDTIPSDDTYSDDLHVQPHYEVLTWENKDYFGLVVALVGLFVARMGMIATAENTSRVATLYFFGTFVAGVLWNAFDVFGYFNLLQEAKDPDSDVDEISPSDARTIAIFTVMLPLGIWILCCGRALQLRQLLEEAEHEAAERIQSELTLSEGNGQSEGADDIPSAIERPILV